MIKYSSNKMSDAFAKASRQATRRGKWRNRANVEIIGKCKDCRIPLHTRDEVWENARGNKLCKNCRYKYKSAKRVHVLYGFSFADVIYQMGTKQRTLSG